jgi:hypothetical protein
MLKENYLGLLRYSIRMAILMIMGLLYLCAGQVYAISGWTDLKQFLVQSNGSRSLGNGGGGYNVTRDSGTKIVYFNASGDNASAQVYWWNGTNIIDSTGSIKDEGNNVYGTDPLAPNEAAIKPFKQPIGMMNNTYNGDIRLRTSNYPAEAAAGGYPDWYLFRRGQTFDTFDGNFIGGRSESQPVVVAAYGPLADGRASFDPNLGQTVVYNGNTRNITNPLSVRNLSSPCWFHMVFDGISFHSDLDFYPSGENLSYSGGPVTLLMEDCAWNDPTKGHVYNYFPRKTNVQRCVMAFGEGYFNWGYQSYVTLDEIIAYRNGYGPAMHSWVNPMNTPDPARCKFNRNFYQDDGAQMGHTYRNMIDADGASGGPQMRGGGTLEDSLIIEGYFFNGADNGVYDCPWLIATNQTGQSGLVRNNVQFIFQYPSPNDPDSSGLSDVTAQPGWGFAFQNHAFGGLAEGNIISGAMMKYDLGFNGGNYGIAYEANNALFTDGNYYNIKNNTIQNNIVYLVNNGLSIYGNYLGAAGNVIQNNVLSCNAGIIDGGTNLNNTGQLLVQNNRFYANSALPAKAYLGSGNTVAAQNTAAATEGWTDPNRTLKRYVTEVLGLTLLDWSDDPFLGGQTDGATAYDPMGLKTFMAVATNMRRGGNSTPPSSGKPSWTGDYAWDTRYTAVAVVNWIRAGFNLPAVTTPGVKTPSAPRGLRVR